MWGEEPRPLCIHLSTFNCIQQFLRAIIEKKITTFTMWPSHWLPPLGCLDARWLPYVYKNSHTLTCSTKLKRMALIKSKPLLHPFCPSVGSAQLPFQRFSLRCRSLKTTYLCQLGWTSTLSWRRGRGSFAHLIGRARQLLKIQIWPQLTFRFSFHEIWTEN